MRQLAHIVRLLLILTTSTVVSAQQASTQALPPIAEEYRAKLVALEQELGRYDIQLLEPLAGLASVLIEFDQFDETDEVLDRAIQIVRINEGLYTPSQLPYLLLTARNEARRDNWEDAYNILEHLTWLYTNKHPELDSELVNELIELSNLHLEGVAADQDERRPLHFRAATRLTRLALGTGEKIWLPTDERLVNLYYQLIEQNYLQSVAVLQGGAVAMDLRKVVPSSGLMRSADDVRQSFYHTGMELFARMRRVYAAASPPDLQAVAMVDLYLADWRVIFDEGDIAHAYQQAYARLLATGVAEDELLAYFSRPQVLPIIDFYPSISSALEDMPPLSDASPATLQFREWSPVFPNVQLPLDQSWLLQEEMGNRNSARLAIDLNGTEKIVGQIRGRYMSQVSVANEMQLLDQSPPGAITLEELEERLHYLNFRPVLVNGEPQSFEGILDYQYFPTARQ